MQCLLTPSLSCFFPHKRSIYLKNLAQNGPLSWYLHIFATPFYSFTFGLGLPCFAVPFTTRFSTVYTPITNGPSEARQKSNNSMEVKMWWIGLVRQWTWNGYIARPAFLKMQDIEDFGGIGTFNLEVYFEGRDPWKYESGTLCSVNNIDVTIVKLLRSGPQFSKDFVLFRSCLDTSVQLMFPLQKNWLFAPPSGVASQLGTIGPCLASGLRRGGEWGKHVHNGWWYDVMLYECCMD